MHLPLLQSPEWKKLQADLGEETVYESINDYTFLGIVKHSRFGNYLYLPYGPYLRDKNAAHACFKALEGLSKAKNLIFIRIEPTQPENAEFLLNLPNCRKSHDLNPADTWILNLLAQNDSKNLEKSKKTSKNAKNPSSASPHATSSDYALSESDLLSVLRPLLPSRLIRYYKNRGKNGLEIEISKNPDDIKYLVELQSKLAKTKKISVFSEKYLKTELKQPFASLYLVKYHQPNNPPEKIADSVKQTAQKTADPSKNSANSVEQIAEKSTPQVIAAGLVFDYADTRYNLQGAQDEKFLKTHATGILTIQLILDAAQKGLKIFDFWGIAPENAPKDHPWAGFTGFKKTFAGHPVAYAGTHDLIFNAKKYRLYQLARRANRTLRKILH